MKDPRSYVNFRLFAISMASLFLEILIIRWISTEIRIFAYFKNLTLIACFLGLGYGYATSSRYKSMWGTLISFSALILAVRTPFVSEEKQLFRRLTEWLSFEDFFVWASSSQQEEAYIRIAMGLGLLLVMLGIIMWTFVSIGRYLGRLFEESPNRIRAYSINVAGSLVGIWLFALFSFFCAPPAIWLVAGILLLIPALIGSRAQLAGLALAIVVSLLSAYAIPASSPTIMTTGGGEISAVSKPHKTVIWSPYQKLTYKDFALVGQNKDLPEFGMIEVNNTFYLFLFNLSSQYTARFPDLFPKNGNTLAFDYYNIPYHFHSELKDILIVGAGGGNDVAAALRNTEARIDAVEIDPKIFALGKEHHPERPYHSKRVTGIIDDARSHFKKSDNKYDLIIFGLLDSHTLASNYSNVSLDNYVYTYESFLDAKRHLKPGGVVVVSFGFSNWIGQRIAKGLQAAFGFWPITFKCFNPVYRGTGGVVFVTGSQDTLIQRIQSHPALKGYVEKNYVDYHSDVEPTTDDWPYLWVRERKIPTLHMLVLGLLVLVSVTSAGVAFRREQKPDGQFFFLGAAFLLLEVHMISKLMLLFGSTWIVNTFVISGVLIMILGANAYVTRVPVKDLRGYYLALFLSLLFVYALPMHKLFVSNYLVRGVLTGLIFTFPLFFAGVIFAVNFKTCKNAAAALGSNLLGAILGGLSESLSFITGIRALTLVALVFYAIAACYYMTGQKQKESPG